MKRIINGTGSADGLQSHEQITLALQEHCCCKQTSPFIKDDVI
jgi:hypothetical protein